MMVLFRAGMKQRNKGNRAPFYHARGGEKKALIKEA